jgi:hypothetical protein
MNLFVHLLGRAGLENYQALYRPVYEHHTYVGWVYLINQIIFNFD